MEIGEGWTRKEKLRERELILGVDRQEDRQTRGLEDREQGQMDQEEETGKASQGAEMKDTQIKR